MTDVVYSLHPSLLIYPAIVDGKRELIIESNCGQPPLLVRDARFAFAISSLPKLFTKAQAFESWSSTETVPPIREEIWKFAVEEQLLIPSSNDDPSLKRAKMWSDHGWPEASSYHEATRDYPFLRMDRAEGFMDDRRTMEDYLSRGMPPSPFLDLPYNQTVELRHIDDQELEGTLSNVRGPSNDFLEHLSIVFDVCAGIRGTQTFANQGQFLLKCPPSGGARHPTEIFLLWFAEHTLPQPGVYHYNSKLHALGCTSFGNFTKNAEQVTYDLFKKYTEPPMGLVVFCLYHKRAMWRYRDARSFRAVLADLGHVLMLFRTVVRRLGLSHYSYQKFRDSELAALLGVDVFETTPFYVSTLV